SIRWACKCVTRSLPEWRKSPLDLLELLSHGWRRLLRSRSHDTGQEEYSGKAQFTDHKKKLIRVSAIGRPVSQGVLRNDELLNIYGAFHDLIRLGIAIIAFQRKFR